MGKFTTKFITSAALPLVIEPVDRNMQLLEFLNLLDRENAFFKYNLLKYGGILLRNFPVQNAQEFTAVIKKLRTGHSIDYIGGDSPRNKITDSVYTSTEAPPSMKLPLHNELSYVKKYPSHIYFYCDTPPVANGETIISDSRKIYQSIDPDVRNRFIEKGLRYISRYPCKKDFMQTITKKHKSWIHVFETENKQEVERKCLENDISFQWNKNDWLEISQVRPSVISHPLTQEKVWFNQAHHFDFNPKFLGLGRYLGAKLFYCRKHTLLHEVFYADGTKIPRHDLYHVMDVMDENTVYFPWQKGDVLVLDNVLAMHGRAPFAGKRRILTSMTG